MCGNRKREPQVHAARIMLDRRVNKFVDLGKRDDSVKLLLDLDALHAHDRAVQIDVLASTQLWMKAYSHFKQASHLSANLCATFGRLGYSRKYLKQRALSGPVAANQSYDFALLDFEGHVLKGPDGSARFVVIAVPGFRRAKWLRGRVGKRIAERFIAFLPVTD